ncbi:MAG TPA: BON domain-containing protein [Thermoanaerobaculia bacterium]|nr:BON domain-containing protein [Thermoanaerobaculia bacterium]
MRRTSHEFVIPAVPSEAVGRVRWFAMHDDLVRSVSDELRWDPRIDVERIVVSVDDSTVTLAGTVQTYSAKCYAEKIAREIRGVIDVKNELEVRLTIGSYRTDAGLARLTSEILQNHTSLCDPLPRITVRDGWLTLDGDVTSDVQKRCAEEALRDVAGIRGVTNHIVVAPPANGGGAAESFEAAVRRRAVLTVRELKVEVSGMTMAVYGEVASCAERDALIELASRRRGIARVEDHVIVQPELVRSVS